MLSMEIRICSGILSCVLEGKFVKSPGTNFESKLEFARLHGDDTVFSSVFREAIRYFVHFIPDNCMETRISTSPGDYFELKVDFSRLHGDGLVFFK